VYPSAIVNIANIYDVYCHDNKMFIASECLELSLADLDFPSFEFEEWEIATIIAEVRTPLSLSQWALITTGCERFSISTAQ